MALLPLLQSAGPLSPTDFTDVVINQHWNVEGYGNLAVGGLLISMFVVAIAYMIAELLKSPQLNAWAKSELYEFIISAVILGNLFFGLTIMNTIVFNMTGGLDHFGVANDYLDQLIRPPSLLTALPGVHAGDITGSYMALWGIEAVSGALGTFQTAFIISAGPRLAFLRVGLSPAAGMSQLTPSILSLLDMIGVIIMAFVAQKALLEFFKETMFKLFLPLGLAMRAFPITRKLGSTLIALAVTCYVIYPLTLVMDMGIYDATPHYGVQSMLVDINSLSQRLGHTKEGTPCQTGGASCPDETSPCSICDGARCVSNSCQSMVGPPPVSCNSQDQCEGAPCFDDLNPTSDCSSSPSCVCHNCPAVGTSCTSDSECCGVCQHDPGDTANPNSKTCQVFAIEPLFRASYNFSSSSHPECNTPDPPTCFTDFDCPCARATGVPNPCVDYGGTPDVKRCKAPIYDQSNVADILETTQGNDCRFYQLDCWLSQMFEKNFRVNSKIDWMNPKLVEYFFFPLALPEWLFNVLASILPVILWPPIVAGALSIVDIVICVTFFRSLSESIGGDPTIWGLSRAV